MDGSFASFDLQRLLFGDTPALFYIEIVLRTLVVYAYALVLLRWLGSRTIGQLSTVEFLLVIALGSAVGDPMFYPDVPLTHALLVVTIVVVANKGLDVLIAYSKAAERAIDGEAAQLIDEGVISRRFLDAKSLGRSEIFQQLRYHGIRHLGQIRAAYVEPNGAISIFRRSGEPIAGLPIEPPWEIEAPPRIKGDEVHDVDQLLACMNCGTLKSVSAGEPAAHCPNCSYGHWTIAVNPNVSSQGTYVAPNDRS